MPDMLVRLKKGKTTYEVMVEEGKVSKYRNGEIRNLSEVLASDIVWLQAGKGKRASAEQLQASFGTSDATEVLELIVRTGASQESEGERAQKNANKRAEVIAYIAKHYVDPKTSRAIPTSRVENALTQAKVKIDPVQPADRQAEAIVSKLADVMPIKRGGAGVVASVTCASKLASAASSAMRKHATITRENFKGGSCTWEVQIHDHDQFVSALNKATKGEFTLSADNPLDSKSGGGGGGGAGPSSGGGGKKGKKKRK